MGIANIINTAGGGGGSSEIITHLVNSVDGAGLRLANQGYISCDDVSANRLGTNDFSVEFVLSQETSAINADIFISNFNSSNQAVDAAVIRWDVVQNDNIQLAFTNSSAAETPYNFGYDPAPDLNEPTHYLVSADRSGNAVLYRNGAEIASVSIAASSSANVGNSGQPTVIGSPVNNFGVTGNVYRFRTYSKALSSDEAKNVFDRADVPTALVSNLLLDLDCAYANPTQSTVIQDRGPNNQDGTLNGTITQTNVIKQLNSTSARIGTTAATPADGEVVANKIIADGGPVTIKSDGSNDTPGRLNLWATDTSIVANDTIGAIHAQGTDTVTSPPEDGAKIEFNADFNWGGSTNYQASRIDFFTQDNSGTNTLLSPRLTIDSNGQSTFTRDGGLSITSNRTTDDGDAIHVRKDNYTRLRLGTLGITFPNGAGAAPTAAAENQLDYYKEGTFTPTFYGGTTAGTYTIGTAVGKYTRIGNMVTVNVSLINITESSAGSGQVIFGGFPFPSGSSSTQGYIGAARVRSYTDAGSSPIVYMGGGATVATMSQYSSGTADQICQVSGISSGNTDISFSLTYFV